MGVKLRVPHRPCQIARSLLPASLTHLLWEKRHLVAAEKLSSASAITEVVRVPDGGSYCQKTLPENKLDRVDAQVR